MPLDERAVDVVLALGLVYVRLLHGPVSLDFLIHPIERAIAEEAADVLFCLLNFCERAGVDLSLDDDLFGAELLGSGASRFGTFSQQAFRNRNAVTSEEGLRLVFVEIHWFLAV